MNTRVLEETMRDVARGELEALEREGFMFHLRVAGDVDGWELCLTRGSGRQLQYYKRVYAPSRRQFEARDYAGILDGFRGELRYLAWMPTIKHGLVIGVAGKWRKWGRAA